MLKAYEGCERKLQSVCSQSQLHIALCSTITLFRSQLTIHENTQ